MSEERGFIDGPLGRIAFRRVAGAGPVIVWLGGFKSDMTGTKAERLADWAHESGRAFLRFDYSGHGASAGRFEDGTISAWLNDALAAIDALAVGRVALVGSSMGGWIAALAALARPERVAGIVLIAPAADFTEELIWNEMTGEERDTVLRDGRIVEPSSYGDPPSIVTRALIEDGRKHLLLSGVIAIHAPVRIIQGMADAEVPWRHALRLAECLQTDDLTMTLIKAGDHRLSKPHELDALIAAIESVSA